MSDLTSVFPFPNMRAAYPAISILGLLVRSRNGRRREQLEQRSRFRVHTPDADNSARGVKIAPRGVRRAKVCELRVGYADRIRKDGGVPPKGKELREKFPFRAVLGHGIKPTEPHADAVAALRTKDHETAQRWAEKQAAARLQSLVTKTITEESTK